MFQWRLKLREARQALAAGRVDEARELLNHDQLREFLPAKQLADEVAEKMVERARQRIAWGESRAGFDDLKQADQLGGGGPAADAVRREYAQSATQQAVARLAAGEPAAALERLDRARRRGVAGESLRGATEVARLWAEARQQADAGEMADAQAKLTRVERLAEGLDGESGAGKRAAFFGLGGGDSSKMTIADRVAAEAAELIHRAEQHQAARERLHTAAADQRWDDALTAVEESLRLAPADPVALGLRRRLWKEVGLGLTRSHHGATPRGAARQTPLAMQSPNRDNGPSGGRRLARSLREEAAAGRSTRRSKPAKEDTAAGAPRADRRMLWVDAVGGYLVCLDDEIVIGQPTGGAAEPGLPILADISRRHAVLRRESGTYVLEPVGAVAVDGQPVTGPTVLGDSHTIELISAASSAGPRRSKNGAVRLRFTRPHALSATARLEIESGHRTTPSADGVLLMAESCVLGAGSHSHVRCRGWKEDVILFRKGDQLYCRSGATLEVDGDVIDGPASVEPGSRVEGEDFALSVELA